MRQNCPKRLPGVRPRSADAAAFPPIGQGGNAAMESAMVLDHCIGAAGASADGLLEDAWSVAAESNPSRTLANTVRDADDIHHLRDAVDSDDMRPEQHARRHGRRRAPFAFRRDSVAERRLQERLA